MFVGGVGAVQQAGLVEGGGAERGREGSLRVEEGA
jgi:hypothetical protein